MSEAGDTIKTGDVASMDMRTHGDGMDPITSPLPAGVKRRTVEDIEQAAFFGNEAMSDPIHGDEPEAEAEAEETEEAEAEAETEEDLEAAEVETQSETEAEEVEAQADETEEPDAAEVPGTRANKRIRQLANERAELRQTLEAMRLQNEQMRQYFAAQEQARLYELQRAQQAEQEQAARRREQEFRERLIAMGHDPNDPYLQVDRAAAERMDRLEQENRAIREALESQNLRERQQRYVNALQQTLDSSLEPYKVDPEMREALYEQAYMLAATQQIQNPAEAVQKALRPFSKTLTKKEAAKPAPKPQPAQATTAQRLVALRGASGGKSKGDTTGKPRKKTVQEIEREWSPDTW